MVNSLGGSGGLGGIWEGGLIFSRYSSKRIYHVQPKWRLCDPCSLKEVNLNYRSRAVAKGLLKTICWGMLF